MTTAASSAASLKLVTPPTSEPITVSLASAWAKANSSDDTTIGALLIAARQQVEADTNLHLSTRTSDLVKDRPPYGDREMCLRVSPVQAVIDVKSYDQDDVESVMSSGDYLVDTYRLPGRLCLNDDASWPSDVRLHNGFIVRVRSGFVGTALTLASLTRSSQTATATVPAGHGLATGEVVTIAGAGQSEYNGTFDVTVTSSTVFTFTVSGSPATPGTGTITATPTGIPAPLLQAMRLLIDYWFMNRGDANVELPAAYHALVAPYKVHFVGD